MPQLSSSVQAAASAAAPIMRDEEEYTDPYIPPVRPRHPVQQQQQQQQQQQSLYQKPVSPDVRKHYSASNSNRRQVVGNRRQRQQHQQLGAGAAVVPPVAITPSSNATPQSSNNNKQTDAIYLDLDGETRLSHDGLSGVTSVFHPSPLHSRDSSTSHSTSATSTSLPSPARTTRSNTMTTTTTATKCWSPLRAYAKDQKSWTSPNTPQHSTTQDTSSGSQHSSPRRQQQQDNSMIMFSDPYEVGSVTTGMSQQELIRKKAREQSRQRHKSSKKKKPKNKIVSLPASLLSSSTNSSNSLEGSTPPPKPPQYQRKDDDDSHNNNHNNNNHNNNNRWRILPKKFQRHNPNDKERSLPPEEMEHSTAETSESGAGEGELDHQNAAAATTTTTTSPQQYRRHQQQQQDLVTDCDTKSVMSEYSFPLLSREAVGGMPVLHEEEHNTTNNNTVLHNITIESSIPATETSMEQEYSDKEADSRARFVRFIDGVVSEQIPWDEEKDMSYDVSAGPMSTTTTSSSSAAAPAPVLQQQQEPPLLPPPQQQQQQQPRSILRTSRFAPQPNRAYTPHSRNILQQQQNSPPRLKVLGKANSSLPSQQQQQKPTAFPIFQPLQARRLPSQQPSGGPTFLDQLGVEVSPIHSEEEDDDDNVVVAAQRQVIQPEDLAQNSRYADPPILQMDDESAAASGRHAATFLETVAAIVIQTAYRRYLAIEFVQFLREELAAQADEVESRKKRVVQGLLLAKEGNGVKRDSQQQFRRKALERDSPEKVSNGNMGDQQRSPAAGVQSPTKEYSKTGPSGNIDDRQQFPPDINSPTRLASRSVRSGFEPSDAHFQSRVISKKNSPIMGIQRSQEAVLRSESRDIANNRISRKAKTRAVFASKGGLVIKKERIRDVYMLAAIRIQAAFRGFWMRDSLNVDHFCAGIIQRTFRKHLHRHNYLFVISRVVYIQSIWRRSLARDYAATLLGAAILMQAFMRGYLTRKRLGRSLCGSTFYPVHLAPIPTEEERAATLIQTTYRRFACEKRYICALVDVLIVQTVVRRWLAGREVHELRQSINNSKIAAVLNQQRGIVSLSETPSVKSYWQTRQQKR